MPSITSSNEQGIWSSIAPYIAPPLAAAGGIVPVFRHMIAKSDLQRGRPVSPMTFLQGVKIGVTEGAPIVGGIVGAQMILQKLAQKVLIGDSKAPSFVSTVASSGLTGLISSPFLAVFNGRTMGWSPRESLQKFSLKQGAAITIQETAFIGGLKASDQLAKPLKESFGDNKIVDYVAAFISGGMGSLAGHPANTILTRWQSKMTVDSFRQCWWGAGRRAYAVAWLSVGYKILEESINSVAKSPK